MEGNSRLHPEDPWSFYRLLSLLVGYLQMTLCILCGVYYIIACITFNPQADYGLHQPVETRNATLENEGSLDPVFKENGIQLGMLIFACLLWLTGGIFLILGVKQEDIQKVESWLMLQASSLTVLVSALALQLVRRDQGFTFVILQDSIGSLISVASIIIVTLYVIELFNEKPSHGNLMGDRQSSTYKHYGSANGTV